MVTLRRSSRPLCLEPLEERAVPCAQQPAAAAFDLSQLAGAPVQTATTIPSNGDLNPYGAAFVPQGFHSGGGPLRPGDLLVSNFNNSANAQGTGTTIVSVSPDGHTSDFFQGPAHPTGSTGLGLTTALGVLRNGFVIVGNVPTTDGTSATVQQGSLLILNAHGQVVQTLTSPTLLDGPWDLAVNDQGKHAQVFVTDVLSGTVTRIDLSVPKHGGAPSVLSETQIASGYAHRTDPAALLLGPTGLAFDRATGNLYVASTADNAVFVIHNALHRNTDAGMGALVYRDAAHLRGPLALVRAPNGDLIVSNGDAVNANSNHPSELVEFTRAGRFVHQFSVDATPGSAFGIALTFKDDDLQFAAVDDSTNSVKIWSFDFDN